MAQTGFKQLLTRQEGRTQELSHNRGSLHGSEIGQMEQQFCWEVLYNLYVLHVGA
jgi:hypothetical protein